MKRVTGPTGRTKKRTLRRTESAKRTVAAPRTVGARAAHDWFASLGQVSDKAWYVEIALDIADRPAMATYSVDFDTRFHINVYPEEWGVYFCHDKRMSWVRVTDQPFVHGRDEYQLLATLPALAGVGKLIRQLERAHHVSFRRSHALVRTNIASAKAALRKWVAEL